MIPTKARTTETKKPVAAPAPLPTSYWNLGTQVPGSQPYVSGVVAPPIYEAPSGYRIVGVELVEPPTTVTQKFVSPTGGRTVTKKTGGKIEVTLEPITAPSLREQEAALIASGELRPTPSRHYSETEFGSGEKPSEALKSYMVDLNKEMQREAIIGYTAVAGLAAGAVYPVAAAKGALIGLGISQAIVGVTEQRLLTPEEAIISAGGGAALSVVGGAVHGVTGVGAMTGVKGVAARAAVSAGLAGGASYLISGGEPEAAMYGAAFGAGFSVAGEALSYAYPRYIKPAVTKAYEKLFPERAMYGRVVSPQQPSKPLTERILGKISPERALYKQVTSAAPKDIIRMTDVPSGTHQLPSTWAKQTLLVKQVTQKTAMKPFLPTLQLTKEAPTVALALTRTIVPKTTTKTVAKAQTQAAKTVTAQQREMSYTIQQQIVNPMLYWQGKPYFRKAVREREEYAYLIYPSATPLETPAQITVPSVVTTPSIIQRQTQTPLTRSILKQTQAQIQRQVQDLTQTQRQSQLVQQTIEQAQTQKQIQKQVQELTQTQQEKQDYKRYWKYTGFEMPPGFSRISDEVFGRYGRYKRKYPLMTGKQMLKEVLKR